MVDGKSKLIYTIRVTFADMIDESLSWHWVSYLPMSHELDCFKHINGIIYDVEVDHKQYLSIPDSLIFKEMEMKAGFHPDMFGVLTENERFLHLWEAEQDE